MGKHTEAVVRAAMNLLPSSKRSKLEVLRAELAKMLEKNSFMVRRAEALYQQALVMTITAQEISAERFAMEQKISEMHSKVEKVLYTDMNARAKRKAARRA